MKLTSLLKKVEALNQKGEFLQIIELLTAPVLQEHNNSTLYSEKAKALFNIGKYEESINAYQIAIEKDPNDADLHYFLGFSYNELGKHEEAAKAYRVAIEIDSSYPYYHYMLGDSYREMEMYNEAINAYLKAIELDPSDEDFHYFLGLSYDGVSKHEDAVKAFFEAIQLNPYNKHYHFGIGDSWRDLKQFDKAIKAYKDAIELDPNDSYPFIQLGYSYQLLNELSNAISAYNEAINLDPSDEYPFFGLGNTYLKLGKYSKSIEAYLKSIELDSNASHSFYGLGNAYREIKEYNKAIKAYQKAIDLDPSDGDYYYYLGLTYHELDSSDDAVKAFKKAIEVDPSDPYYYIFLGLIYNHKFKQPDKTELILKEAIQAIPSSKEILLELGELYLDLKRYEEAIDFFNRAIQADPNHAFSYYYLANAYYEIKQYEKALGFYNKYLEVDLSITKYFTSFVKSRITELKKLIGDAIYSRISELVEQIKSLLLYKEDCITHYTSLSVAKILILEESKFRLSEGAFLNDTSEGRELFKFLSFNITSTNSNDTVAELFTQKPFIGSFVAEVKHDDLTLWRMYGKEAKEEAKGCAITINREKFLEEIKSQIVPNTSRNKDKKDKTSSKIDDDFNFYRVAYRREGVSSQFIIPGVREEAERALNELMKKLFSQVAIFKKRRKKVSDKQNLIKLLNEVAYLFKSVEYQYEHELRLVVEATGITKEIDKGMIPPRVFIELGSIRPFLNKITLGPKVDRADEWAAALYYSLDKDNYNPDIYLSHLPFK